MPTGTINLNATLGGISITGSMASSDAGLINHEVTLSAGVAGTLSTRGGDTAGTLTLAADHGITDGLVIDIYWTGGVAYGATVGTVSGTSVPFTGAAGDVLPTEDDAIIACVVTTIDTDFDGDLVSMILVQATQRAHLNFIDSGTASLETVEIAAANGWWAWDENMSYTRPITGNPVDAIIASSGSATAATLKVAVLYDSDG